MTNDQEPEQPTGPTQEASIPTNTDAFEPEPYEPEPQIIEIELPSMGAVHWMIVFLTRAQRELRLHREILTDAGSEPAVRTLNEADHAYNIMLDALNESQKIASQAQKSWEMTQGDQQAELYPFDVTHPASALDTSDESAEDPPKE